MFSAAVANESNVRDDLISLLYAHAGNNNNNIASPFPTLYDMATDEPLGVDPLPASGVTNGSGARSVSMNR